VAEAVEDLIDTIADHLRSRTYTPSVVKAVVRIEIEHLLPMELARPPLFGMQTDNQEYADEIEKLTNDLIKKLKGGPPGTLNALFILASRTEPLKWSLLDTESPAVTHYREKLLKVLADLKRGCQEILANKKGVGDHHNRDRVKQVCAGCALDLIVGLEAGKPTNSSTRSPIRVISAALFEAIAPDQPAKGRPGLREQCVQVIGDWRKMSADDMKAHIERLRSKWELPE
jgi:hypothetical protein